MPSWESIKTDYVKIIGQACDTMHQHLVAKYGGQWSVRIDGAGDGRWRITFEQQDSQGERLAGESFVLTIPPPKDDLAGS